jgi:NitT/TauT family transport system ATP-binding protein
LTAAQNVDLALRLADVPAGDRHGEAQRLLRMVQLGGFGDMRPHQLSGGMRQRTALARAFAQRADIMLMDEPFGSLDAMTRDALHDELERLWVDVGFSVLFVTHNVREAVRLGDRVAVLTSRPGRIADEFPIDLPRPRRMSDPRVGALAEQITDRLRQEVARHADR